MRFAKISYHDFDGVVIDTAAREALAREPGRQQRADPAQSRPADDGRHHSRGVQRHAPTWSSAARPQDRRPCRATPRSSRCRTTSSTRPTMNSPAACPPPVRRDGLAGIAAEARPDRSGLPRLIEIRRTAPLRTFAALAAGYWTAPGYRCDRLDPDPRAWWCSAPSMSASRSGSTSGIATSSTPRRSATPTMLVEQLYILAAIVVSGRGWPSPSTCISAAACRSTGAAWLTQVTTRRWLHAGPAVPARPAGRRSATTPTAASPRTSASRPSLPSSSPRRSCNASCSSSPSSSVLWVLSGTLPIKVGTFEFSLPGYMVWAAVLYALFGSILTYALGGGLIAGRQRAPGPRGRCPLGVDPRPRERRGHRPDARRGRRTSRLHGAHGRPAPAWHAQTRGQGSLALLTSSLAYLAPIVAADRRAAALSRRRAAVWAG